MTHGERIMSYGKSNRDLLLIFLVLFFSLVDSSQLPQRNLFTEQEKNFLREFLSIRFKAFQRISEINVRRAVFQNLNVWAHFFIPLDL